MPRLVSLNAKVQQVLGLVGTKDVSRWEDDFLDSIAHRTADGADTSSLSEKQIDVIERIWSKHFA